MIYRSSIMLRYDVAVRDVDPCVAPGEREDTRIERSRDVQRVLASNPYLSSQHVDALHSVRATCVVAIHQGEIVGSLWGVSGCSYEAEVGGKLDLRRDEHFLCRAYVRPEHRGQRLLARMIAGYANGKGGEERLIAFVYPWNTPSITTLETTGWLKTHSHRRRVLFGSVTDDVQILAPGIETA